MLDYLLDFGRLSKDRDINRFFYKFSQLAINFEQLVVNFYRLIDFL